MDVSSSVSSISVRFMTGGGLVVVVVLVGSLTLGCLLVFLCLALVNASNGSGSSRTILFKGENALYATGVFTCGCGVEGF